MRVSEYYQLDRIQPELDFVDVDILNDAKVFIDPRALRLLPSDWGDECVYLVQNFFQTIIEAIKNNRDTFAKNLLCKLKEPNETHLGLSKGKARGRCLGKELVGDVWDALNNSEATRSGLLEDLEDTILMIDGIRADIVSDITTNIIRTQLIKYTQDVAGLYGIPLQKNVDSGVLWNADKQEWYSKYVDLPITKYGKLILVPKIIVRHRMDYDVDEYYRHYILEYLQEIEIQANSELVQLLKNGRSRVTKKAVQEKYGSGKSTIVRETQNYPEILESYRKRKRNYYQPPLDHNQISMLEGSPEPEWEQLINSVSQIKPGKEEFSIYEKAIEKLLTTLFYPSLTNPKLQREIHEGRKRIDLTYTNAAREGFFSWLSQHYPSPHIFIECKNYTGDLGNAELDQLAGRFSPSRGKIGILICRSFNKKDLFFKRCRDTANDDRGYIVPLDDDDLRSLVNERERSFSHHKFSLLQEKFNDLIM